MMTFKDVEFVGGADSTFMGGGFCNQDYFINFSNDYSLWVNLDDYDLSMSIVAEEIDNFVTSYGETINEEEINKAIEALKECYELNKGTLSRDSYIARLAELYCDDTIVAEAQLKDSVDNVEIYTLRFTIKKDGWKETTKAFVDVRNPSMVDFPSDWQSDYPISMFVNEEGHFEYPENFRFITLYMSEGKVHEY